MRGVDSHRAGGVAVTVERKAVLAADFLDLAVAEIVEEEPPDRVVGDGEINQAVTVPSALPMG
jgi:hypothetical protein